MSSPDPSTCENADVLVERRKLLARCAREVHAAANRALQKLEYEGASDDLSDRSYFLCEAADALREAKAATAFLGEGDPR